MFGKILDGKTTNFDTLLQYYKEGEIKAEDKFFYYEDVKQAVEILLKALEAKQKYIEEEDTFNIPFKAGAQQAFKTCIEHIERAFKDVLEESR